MSGGRNHRRKRVLAPVQATALAACLGFALGPPLAQMAHADSFDRVCGSYVKSCGEAPPETASERAHLCQASLCARDGAKANRKLSNIWTAVAGVCAAQCVASLANHAFPAWKVLKKIPGTKIPLTVSACSASHLAGTLTEGALTKNFQAALMSYLSSTAMSVVTKAALSGGLASSAQEVAEKAGKPKDIPACLTAVMAGGKASSKNHAMKSDRQAAEANLRLAMQTEGPSGAAVAATSLASQNPPSANGAPSQANAVVARAVSRDPRESSRNSCLAGARDTSGVLACAVAGGSDQEIPSILANKNFDEDLKAVTGKELGDFLALSEQSFPEALSTAMTAPLGDTASAPQIAQAIRADQDSPALGVDGTSYASSGGSRGSGGAQESAPDFNSLFQGVMAQMMPGQKDRSPSSVNELSFGKNGRRYHKKIAEDPTVSIFDRISFRYRKIETGGLR